MPIIAPGPDFDFNASPFPFAWDPSFPAPPQQWFTPSVMMNSPLTDATMMPLDSSTDIPMNPWGIPLLPSESSTTSTAPLSDDSLLISPDGHSFPPHAQLLELVELFFERVHCYMPLLHRSTFTQKISTQGSSYNHPLLLYAVISMVARFHADPTIRAQQQDWCTRARILYEATPHAPEQGVETLQAAACITLQASTAGDYSSPFSYVAKAWRQVVVLGIHHSDSPSRLVLPGLTVPPTDDWRELEERRRVVWMLFVLDRVICFPVGFANAIDDRQFKLPLPMNEQVFQESDDVCGVLPQFHS